jgi:hypothetical protein
LGGRRTPLHPRDEIELPIEDLLIEKKQGAQRLILGGSSYLSFNGKVAKEGGDVRFAHFVGVALAMKEDETSNPVDVRLFGAQTVMLDPQMPADSVEQFGRWSRGNGSGVRTSHGGCSGKAHHDGRPSALWQCCCCV